MYASTFMLVSLSIDRVDAIARPMNFTRKGKLIFLWKRFLVRLVNFRENLICRPFSSI